MRTGASRMAALALLPLLTLAGCGNSTKDALAFNQTIVGANQKLETAGREFGEALVRATTGGPADVAQARQSYDKTRQMVRQLKVDMQSVQVPDSASAQALYDAHQKFLQAQVRMIENDLGEAVRLLENTKVDRAEQTQRVAAILKRIGNAEQADLAALQSAQRKFAEDYHLTLK